jgi:hypothetical protein
MCYVAAAAVVVVIIAALVEFPFVPLGT